MTKTGKLKAGDRVKCISDDDIYLKVGEIYVVAAVPGDYDYDSVHNEDDGLVVFADKSKMNPNYYRDQGYIWTYQNHVVKV